VGNDMAVEAVQRSNDQARVEKARVEERREASPRRAADSVRDDEQAEKASNERSKARGTGEKVDTTA